MSERPTRPFRPTRVPSISGLPLRLPQGMIRGAQDSQSPAPRQPKPEAEAEAGAEASIVLIMIVKNEGAIIQRLMRSCLGIVSGFCICDTGSTDDTVAKVSQCAESANLPCAVPRHKWKNFGVNRSLSFAEGVKFCDAQGWDRSRTFGLLLDGDMILKPQASAEAITASIRNKKGVAMMQRNGGVEYFNMRLVRFDCPWRCVGATHEFWACAGDQSLCNERLDPSLMFIEDVNDGGAKADKFERDVRMLTEELATQPRNHRTLFYLAQSYQNSGKPEAAIPLYERRIQAGGWAEEVWYSHLSIARCHLNLKSVVDAEHWYNKAIALNPKRAEPYFELARLFRETVQPFKAWHYCERGVSLPKPEEGLFVESDVYEFRLKHEMTMISYFVDPEDHSRRGIRACLGFLALDIPAAEELRSSCFWNMHYYIKPISGTSTPPTRLLHLPDFETFTPSSISVLPCPGPAPPTMLLANVRYVDYRMADRSTVDGADVYLPSAPGQPVRTVNRLVWIDAFSMDPIPSTLMAVPYDSRWVDFVGDRRSLVHHPSAPIKGLEDVRLERFESDGSIAFSATQMEFRESKGEGEEGVGNPMPPEYRMVRGRLDGSHCISRLQVLPAMESASCEKNWLSLDDSHYIYSWHPFRLLRLGTPQSFETMPRTPPWWKHVRGSAVGNSYGGHRYVLTHFKYNTPQGKGSRMTYFHMLVRLRPADSTPRTYSQPFVFAKHNVEFCLGFHISAAGLCTFYTSSRDASPARVQVPISSFTWIEL